MVNKQIFQNYKAELETKIGNKITEPINKPNEASIAKLENNEDEIILKNKDLLLENRVSKLES